MVLKLKDEGESVKKSLNFRQPQAASEASALRRPRLPNRAPVPAPATSGLLVFRDDGWVEGITHIPSPNFNARPDGVAVDLVVLHNISLPPGQFGGPGIIDLFTNKLNHDDHPYYATLRELHVSCHFLIRRDGELIQFVSCDDRAWHAGVSKWEDRENCNDFSIGIELEGADDQPFKSLQYDAAARLTKSIRARYPIRGVMGHSHIAPERKTDPGPYFDWRYYLYLTEER
ncbi:MAG TPA: 1,6-anhydro-N-acetylmuramyl-L-alanine amidase AmpD [Burkholderiales bacterium]|nr:1,6-anhydro-N-acetylmuramyl-L-alanine amidase AmpD [Burkholderiales bacterium]